MKRYLLVPMLFALLGPGSGAAAQTRLAEPAADAAGVATFAGESPTTTLQARSWRAAVRPDTLGPNFDTWAEALMEEWKVPGMAVGVIRNGDVVLLKGYGLRDVEARQPVTPRTLLAIGSNSKSFTVVLMGQLVAEGKLDWDAPVREYLPDFQLYDDYATREMRVRDLVTHVSGLPRHDLLWYGRSFDREQLFQRLRYLEPSTSFRGRWQYQNLMFLTAGHLVERVTGRSWDDLIRERIFAPLEMTRSNTSVEAMPGSGDFSYPYVLRDGRLEKVPFRNIDAVGPAGSINSSVEEMLHYVQMHIQGGEWRGERVLEAEQVQLMRTPQSVVATPWIHPELGPETYGLALWLSSYRGHRWVQHGGGIDGFISQMAWLPDDSIGVVVLTNMSGEANPVPNLVVQRVFDELLGLEPIDWNARSREQIAQGQKQQEERRKKREAERVAGTSPTHPLEEYAGEYVHPGYGTVRVAAEGGRLRLYWEEQPLALEHYHYDVFEFSDETSVVPLSGLVSFGMDTRGRIDRLMIPLESSIDDIVFEKEVPPEPSGSTR